MTTCDKCGQPYEIGDWPWCPHGKYRQHSGFEPHFDYGVGRYVNGFGDINVAMREQGLTPKDRPGPGELSASRDRIMAKRAEEARGGHAH